MKFKFFMFSASWTVILPQLNTLSWDDPVPPVQSYAVDLCIFPLYANLSWMLLVFSISMGKNGVEDPWVHNFMILEDYWKNNMSMQNSLIIIKCGWGGRGGVGQAFFTNVV